MKHVIVMSRSDFEKYAKSKHTEDAIAISIVSKNEPRVNERCTADNHIKHILRIYADDVDTVEKGGIVPYDGKRISDLINKYSSVDTIIVHCGAGQSRSAGVGAAILKHFNGSDSEIFDNPRYTPNMLFYRTVLNTLEGVETFRPW